MAGLASALSGSDPARPRASSSTFWSACPRPAASGCRANSVRRPGDRSPSPPAGGGPRGIGRPSPADAALDRDVRDTRRSARAGPAQTGAAASRQSRRPGVMGSEPPRSAAGATTVQLEYSRVGDESEQAAAARRVCLPILAGGPSCLPGPGAGEQLDDRPVVVLATRKDSEPRHKPEAPAKEPNLLRWRFRLVSCACARGHPTRPGFFPPRANPAPPPSSSWRNERRGP